MKDHTERALVTGVAGFLGSHVAEVCHGLGMSVVGIDDLSGGFVDNVPDGTQFVVGSVTDGSFVRSLWDDFGPFDYVYHLAAYAAEGLSHFIRRYNYTNNLVGSMTLINEAIRTKARRFVFTSSIAVYGTGQLPLSEDTVPQPEDPYGVAKLAVELDLRAASEYFGLNYTVFRPHNVYGARQNIADPYRNVIGIFMNRILRKQPMPIFGDGTQTRAFTHVGDVAPLIARSVRMESAIDGVFNIGADTPTSVKDLAQLVASVMGVECDVEYLPPRHEVQHAFADHRKLRATFGDNAAVPLVEGLQSMAEWVRHHGTRDSTPFARLELTEKLPPSWRSLLS